MLLRCQLIKSHLAVNGWIVQYVLVLLMFCFVLNDMLWNAFAFLVVMNLSANIHQHHAIKLRCKTNEFQDVRITALEL